MLEGAQMHQVNSDRGLEGLQCSRCGSETSEKMFDWDGEWNISFAGCGFRSIYYLGALSCIFQRAPQLLYGASKICGASSGCLVAAALTVGIPIEEFCVDVLSLAKEVRKHTLGVFHPTFSLLREVRDSLQEKLPADAHLRASGRLCVSLTRLADGQNILVSEFDSREELIQVETEQVLTCSCFFPVYCGFTPPQYRGVRYMDGALSNNMPLFEQSNTITLAPFSGESDICPRESTFNFLEVDYGNVSIQVNTANVHRVCTSFLPTKPQMLAEICNNGYVDALRFLRERDLLGTQQPLPSLGTNAHTVEACCERAKSAQAQESKKTLVNGQGPHLEDHWWLDLKVIENLPLSFKRVLCEACRDSHDDGRLLPVKVLLCLLTYLMLPIELVVSLLRSLVLSVCRLLMSTTGLCRQMRSNSWKDPNSSSPDKNMTHHPNETLHWDNNGNLDLLLSLNPSRAGLPDFKTHNTPQRGQVALHHRRKSLHHQP